MANIVITEASGQLPALFGDIQEPLCSYIEHRAEIIEAEEKAMFKIFRQTKSTHFAEGYRYETEMDDMLPVGENGAYPTTGYQEGYPQTIYNETFKQSFAISQEAIEDNVLTTIQRKPEKLLRAYYRGRARLLARMIGEALQGHDSFVVNGRPFKTTCSDGQNVFSSSHPLKVKGGTQSNVYSDAFSASSLFAGMTAMQNQKDDNGNTLGISPDTILIGNNNPNLKKTVIEVVASMQSPGTANNDINPVFGNFEIVIAPYLNDFLGSLASPWILFDSKYNQDNDGNVYQDRVPLTIKSDVGANDENIWKARARYGVGFVDYRQMMAFGVTGANSL